MALHEQPLTIVIMAGGTGGHIFPALATADELRGRGCNIHWIGTPDSMEADLVPKNGFGISFIPVTGLRGKKISFLFKAPWRLVVSLLKAVKILRQQKPICVLGMGGYVTGPGGVAAKLLGIPLVIHEQNSVAGLTNRLLSRFASRVLEGFPGAFSSSKCNGGVFTTGNPVRSSIFQQDSYKASSPLRLLVLGGSRGAVAINKLIPFVFSHGQGKFDIWHQTGRDNIKQCLTARNELNIVGEQFYRVEPFIDDMARAYGWADLVLCRSGALTVSELAGAGRPSILIPYPYAVDDHQAVNGRYLVDRGAAVMVLQQQLDEDTLITLLLDLDRDSVRLESMAASAKAVGQMQAAQVIADHCLEVRYD
ncbi:MAG: undecaprenyldiphospho-muramoylpentapeptide beta-N-acetylglucosaminyltransferase [Candidatus Endonucleobacter bathymodioli]|uniref:UDP-N-acetylglucosamine--N-acetylmuramyl-(pentapeptide) pyrophosphoryl-undecaprenol N-acetylglucosamine transferase n=1 Tax=Candidatus Endonucleibacter bathymodioli TaxID=539814 RepID=A0AA90P135_9GAMM|nr:undecaprenyldiphospho-muramoylpentapeptide beta-N-acetylglucosaminyltransferase [Candidatus Endonucleobacter bathymodioli]